MCISKEIKSSHSVLFVFAVRARNGPDASQRELRQPGYLIYRVTCYFKPLLKTAGGVFVSVSMTR